MKVVASRQLDGYPADLTTVDNNVVLLMSRDQATFLEAYDANLTPVWSKRLDSRAVALLAADGTPWVLDSEGAWACGDGGHCLARVRVEPSFKGMRLSAFGSVGDGFVFACEHGASVAMRPPILKHVKYDGVTRWSIELPVGTVEHEGVVEFGVNTGWKPQRMRPWLPRSWISISRTVAVSGNAVLVCFSDTHHSGIGLGYVVSLTDGALVFTTKKGPIPKSRRSARVYFWWVIRGTVPSRRCGTSATAKYWSDGRVTDTM
jgi:hypothetical protein